MMYKVIKYFFIINVYLCINVMYVYNIHKGIKFHKNHQKSRFSRGCSGRPPEAYFGPSRQGPQKWAFQSTFYMFIHNNNNSYCCTLAYCSIAKQLRGILLHFIIRTLYITAFPRGPRAALLEPTSINVEFYLHTFFYHPITCMHKCMQALYAFLSDARQKHSFVSLSSLLTILVPAILSRAAVSNYVIAIHHYQLCFLYTILVTMLFLN